jgi:type VI secretion system protein ImpA
MYTYEFLVAPVSDAEPCGPDLDLRGDNDFMNFTAFADSVLPASYFRFDRSEVDLAGQITAMKKLLQATRDLRLLVILAKYQILDRQLEPFVNTVAAIATLVTEHWQEVNPRGEDGDFALRVATLESLDDMAQVILPLQHQALFRSRKTGAISLRTHLIATGKLAARENEEAFDTATLDNAIGEADIREIVAARDLALKLKQSLGTMQTAVREGLDFRGSVSIERLAPLVDDMNAFLEGIVALREPTKAAGHVAKAEQDSTTEEAPAATAAGGLVVTLAPPGAIATLDEVERALKAVGRYYAQKEPSSPALLLIRQAQSLVGKGFFDGIRALLPSHASEANIVMGAKPGFDLSIERLADVANEFPPEEDEQAEPDDAPDTTDDGWGAAHESSDNEAPSEDADDPVEDPDSHASEASDPDGPGEDEHADATGADTAAPAVDVEVSDAASQGPRVFVVKHRPEAFALMSAVQEYYLRMEPASPVPLLLDRARNIGTMDFLAMMRLVMPQGAFRSDNE